MGLIPAKLKAKPQTATRARRIVVVLDGIEENLGTEGKLGFRKSDKSQTEKNNFENGNFHKQRVHASLQEAFLQRDFEPFEL
jgi:hypothetical protein